MIQEQPWFQNLGQMDYILFSLAIVGLIVLFVVQHNKKRSSKPYVDEHAIHLGCDTIPSTAFIGPGLAKF